MDNALYQIDSSTRSKVIQNLGARHLCAILLSMLLIYGVLLVVYRLYLSPIAAIPGPKLAALTEWYEFYYHLIKNGQFGRAVERMHDKYGEPLNV